MNWRERPEMHRILLLLSETCLPDFLINPIGKNFCSFSFFALIIFYQFEVFNPIDDIFVVSASSLNCCFYQFVILSYILYFLTFCIFNLYSTFLKTTLSDRKLPNKRLLLLLYRKHFVERKKRERFFDPRSKSPSGRLCKL